MYSEAFYKLAAFAGIVHGVPLNQYYGCVETQIDERWWFSMNPHGVPIECSKSVEVPPYSAYVEVNGFPAGVLCAQGGMILHSAGGNEQALISALDERMRRNGEGT